MIFLQKKEFNDAQTEKKVRPQRHAVFQQKKTPQRLDLREASTTAQLTVRILALYQMTAVFAAIGSASAKHRMLPLANTYVGSVSTLCEVA